ncbi:AMP-binding protein [Streptomyces adustus]|uniref:AMP-binding protein n=1 Tax=Streptomyces adustus TaxID=1609272 RepID=A0A5N8VG65_9ACTN|nr:AMP-binding protein [Streptomyces adustus]
MREFTTLPSASAPPVGGLADVVFRSAEEDPGQIALGRKDEQGQWQDVTSAEFRDEVLALAKGLLALSVHPGDRVAVMSRSGYEWTLLNFALWSIGAQGVPIHPTSSAEECFWMLYDAEVSTAIVEHGNHAMTIATNLTRLPRLRQLWRLDTGCVRDLYQAGAHLDDEVVHRHREAVTPESTATVIYTSGTTDCPEACVLSHGNLMFETDTGIARWKPAFPPKKGDKAATRLFGWMMEIAAIRSRVRSGHRP